MLNSSNACASVVFELYSYIWYIMWEFWFTWNIFIVRWKNLETGDGMKPMIWNDILLGKPEKRIHWYSWLSTVPSWICSCEAMKSSQSWKQLLLRAEMLTCTLFLILLIENSSASSNDWMNNGIRKKLSML